MTTLIGGEMLLWSDLDGTHGPAPAGGPALRSLLRVVTGRTLVAGPHDPELLSAIGAGSLTVLVRGLADAEALARTGVTVLCGSLEKVAAVPAYDTIVALDGLDRLISAEAEDRSWSETLGLLTALLAPGGRLLLGVENTFGVHRLVSPPLSPTDSDWVVPGDRTPARLGLEITRRYAAYPGPARPSVLLGPEVLADPAVEGFVAATLSAAYAGEEGAVLADPARLAKGALRHGLAAELAPAWIVVAGPADGLPDAVTAEWLSCDDLPRGRTLEDLLLDSCRRRDLPAVRGMLSDWLNGAAAGVPADRIVVDDGGGLTGLAPAGPPLVVLRDFAATLIRGGDASLWPSPAGEAGLTAVLAGMTGRELSPDDVPPAAAGPDRPVVTELIAARDRLTRELAEARAKHEWYERTLVSREAELKRVRKINAVLSATLPGRLVMATARRLRTAIRR